jgi:mannose-6-phosphate isomerase
MDDGSTVPLRDLIEAFPEPMLGAAHAARFGAELGVLCKILDSAMRLSIQAHPDAAFARRHLGADFGKTESWIILATRPIDGVPPYILFGFREGVEMAAFRRATRSQDVPMLEAALNRIPVRPGEVYLVPAGTPHALGPGVLLVEVQEPTDFVVNAEAVCGEVRRTEAQCFMGLDFDRAMACFDPAGGGPEFLRRMTLIPRAIRREADMLLEGLIGPEDTPCFGAHRLTVRGAAEDPNRGRTYIGIVAAGRGRLAYPGGEIPLAPASTLFVPAAAGSLVYRGEPGEPLVLLACFPPAA